MDSAKKPEIIECILNELEKVRAQTVLAAKQAYDTATAAENKAENKYDTLGLEAAYLAEGQSRRVHQCEQDILAFKKLPVISFSKDTPIQLGAIIRLLDQDDNEQYFFLGPAAGGLSVSFIEEEQTQICFKLITPLSPIGTALKGLYVGDELELKLSHNTSSYEIMALA